MQPADRGHVTKKVFIKTYGCQMNVYDSDRMAQSLAPHGYEPVAGIDDADLVILNTCHIREKAAEKVFSELGRLRRARDARREASGRDMLLAVAGCVAQAEGELLAERAPFVDVVVGPQAYHRLPELLARRARAEARLAFALAVIAFLWLGMDGLSGRLSSSDLAVAMIAVTGTMSMSFMGWEAWDIDYGLASMRAYRRIEARAAAHGRDPERESGRRRSTADAPAVEAAQQVDALLADDGDDPTEVGGRDRERCRGGRVDAQALRQVGLRVDVDQQHAAAAHGQRRPQA